MNKLDVSNWKDTDWALLSYSLRLHQPIAARNAAQHTRRGFLVIKNNPWGIGVGEAAPIPGFHSIHYDQLKAELHTALHDPSKISESTPIAKCAIEMASWNGTVNSRIPINGLLTASQSTVSGFSCYKIKVGRAPIDEEIAMLKTIAASLPSHTSVRLDANCAWNLSTCMEFWEQASALPLNIEYIEEPLQNPNQYSDLTIPFALDERLETYSDRLQSLSSLKALIIKPSMHGFRASLEWIYKAKALQLSAVISSTFESSVGLLAYAQLAARQPQTPAGLATLSWFVDDLLYHQATPQQGLLHTLPAKEIFSRLQWEHLSLISRS